MSLEKGVRFCKCKRMVWEFPANSAITRNLDPENHFSCDVRDVAGLPEQAVWSLLTTSIPWRPSFALVPFSITSKNLHCPGFLFRFHIYIAFYVSLINSVTEKHSEIRAATHSLWKMQKCAMNCFLQTAHTFTQAATGIACSPKSTLTGTLVTHL